MDVKKVIEQALNKYVNNKNITFLVVKNQDKPSHFTPAIKTLSVTLWLLARKKRIELVTVDHNARCISDAEYDKATLELYSIFYYKIIELITTNKLSQIINKDVTI